MFTISSTTRCPQRSSPPPAESVPAVLEPRPPEHRSSAVREKEAQEHRIDRGRDGDVAPELLGVQHHQLAAGYQDPGHVDNCEAGETANSRRSQSVKYWQFYNQN